MATDTAELPGFQGLKCELCQSEAQLLTSRGALCADCAQKPGVLDRDEREECFRLNEEADHG